MNPDFEAEGQEPTRRRFQSEDLDSPKKRAEFEGYQTIKEIVGDGRQLIPGSQVTTVRHGSMIYARPTRLGSERLFLAKEAPNRLFDSTLHHHVKKARVTIDASGTQPSLVKESSHPPIF